jgi:hypothetical protein
LLIFGTFQAQVQIVRLSEMEGGGCLKAASGVMRGAMILELESETNVEVKRHEEVFEVRAQVICSEAIHFP